MNINWATGVITVYKTDPFMVFAGGNIYNMDTNLFRLALKDAEDDPIGMPFPDTHRHNTTVLLGGIEYARIIEILSPYTITFDDTGGAWVCNLIGSNNNVLDRANLTTVQIRSNNSAGLTQMQEIQYSSFENGVTVDVLNGTSGTIYPSGTRRKPVNNLSDAMVIADLYGFATIYVIGDLTIDSGGIYTGMSFVGESKNKSTLTVSDAANVYKCEFYEAHIAGVLDGDSVLRDCLVDNLNYVSGFVERCVLAPGVITLGGLSTAHFLDCYSGVPGFGTPTINMGGNGPPLAMRNYNGGIALENKSGNSSVSIDLNSGQVVLANTVTAGTIVLRGMGKLTDNSVGATVNSENLLDLPKMVAAVWTYAQRELTSGLVVADAVWDEMKSGHTLPGSYGEELATVSDIQASVSTDLLNYTSGSIIEGLLNSGSIANTNVRDGNYWTISETALGLTVEFIFNLPSIAHRPGAFGLFGRYDGKGSAHYLEVWFWNVESSAWEQLQEKFIPNGTSDELYSSNYNEQHVDRDNGNEVKVRIVHNVTSYSTTHDLYIDVCHLTAINVVEPSATPQEVWEYASRTLTPNVPTAQENAQAVVDHPETLTTRKYIGYQP